MENNPPELIFTLWCLRKNLFHDQEDTMEIVKDIGFKSIEIAGFTDPKPLSESILSTYDFAIKGLACPPITPEKHRLNLDFYTDWINRYCSMFPTDTLTISSLPFKDLFHTYNSRKRLKKLLYDIANFTNSINKKISYHPFSHDFNLFDGTSFVDELVRDGHPSNFGLQLDTYWMYINGIKPENLNSYPIHSIHLNEIDENGNNVVLGTSSSVPEKCLNYISSLKNRHEINWILENVSLELSGEETTARSIEIIKDCFENWDSIWNDSISVIENSSNYSKNTNLIFFDEEDENHFNDADTYRDEIRECYTENLFGNGPISALDRNDFRLKYYVNERELVTNDVETYEDEFFKYFTNRGNNHRTIYILGNSGSGKTTFLRYFFQYYLSNREIIIDRTLSEQSIQHKRRLENSKSYLYFYLDLRPPYIQDSFTRYFLELLVGDIQDIKKYNLNIEQIEQVSNMEIISRINDYSQKHEQKKLIVIVDNADQLNLDEQSAMIALINNLESGSWRFVIPARQESVQELMDKIEPASEYYTFPLGKLNKDDLIAKRGDFISDIIKDTDKHTNDEIVLTRESDDGIIILKPFWNTRSPKENAETMSNRASLAYKAICHSFIENKDIDQGKKIIDLLSGDSARRHLEINKRITFSESFSNRLSKKWITKYYFLDGLIRGRDKHFKDTGRIVINIFNVVDSRRLKADSVCLGLHLLYLLDRGNDWSTSKSILLSIGYKPIDIDAALRRFRKKDLILGYQNVHRVSNSLVAGTATLIYERSYLDNMAIYNSTSWELSSNIYRTSCLKRSDFLKRAASTVWFLEKIHDCEKKVFIYNKERINSEYKIFKKTIRKTKLPYFSPKLAECYLQEITAISKLKYIRPYIDRELARFNNLKERLQSIVTYGMDKNNRFQSARPHSFSSDTKA